MPNREDYIREVDATLAPSALRSRIAALPERTAPRRKVRRVLRVLAMAACAACALLALYGAGVLWSMTHWGGDLRPAPPVLTALPATPTPEPTPKPDAYTIPLQNTKKYAYAPVEPEPEKSPAEIALALAKLYLEDLMTDSEERTFRITQYKDLDVTLHLTTAMEEWEQDDYNLQESELGEDRWVVDLQVTYQYEGVIDPFGRNPDQWIELLYQGSPMGFLLVKENGVFTLQSRWEAVRGGESGPMPTAEPITIPAGIIDENVDAPDDVLAAAVAWVRESYARYTAELRGEWQARGEEAVYDNWRIDAIDFCEQYNGLPSHPINVYRLSWRIHTTTPELGGNLAGSASTLEDGWFTPGYGCDYLVFLCTNDNRSSFLFYLMINDCEPGSDTFRSDLERELLAHIPVPHPNGSVAGDINVPDSVLHQANEYVREQYLLAHLPQKYGISRPADNYYDDWQVNSLPDFDDWHITELSRCYVSDDIVPMGMVEVYTLQWGLHTTTPELAQQHTAGARYVDEENWWHDHPSYLIFLRHTDGEILEYLTDEQGGGLPPADDEAFDTRIRSAVTRYYKENPPIENGLTRYSCFANFRGLDLNTPLDELPAQLLDSLTFTGEVVHMGDALPGAVVYYAVKTYTSPTLTLKTLKLDTEWMAAEVAAGRWTQERADGWINDAIQANGSAEREFIWGVSPKDGSLATYAGLHVGMTAEEAQALYYPLREGENKFGQPIFSYFTATVTDGVVTALEVEGGVRVLGNTGN